MRRQLAYSGQSKQAIKEVPSNWHLLCATPRGYLLRLLVTIGGRNSIRWRGAGVCCGFVSREEKSDLARLVFLVFLGGYP